MLFKLAVSDGKKVDAKKYLNCVEEPIFQQPDETLVIDLIALPELHIMLGATMKIYEGLLGRISESKSVVEDWSCHQGIM